MTFKAIAGIVAAQVDWLGEATYNVGLDTVPLTITVDAPGVTTGLGNGYGPAGGKIFFDKEAYFGGWRYLEAAPSDQSTSIAWSNITDTATGFMGMSGEFGTGQANTTAIVGQVVGEVHCTAGAAYLCDNLTFGGYSDWFLPSREDLRQMYMSKDSIGGFSGGFGSILYWSSTESTPMPTTEAMAVNFSNNIAESQAKVNLYYLRAVRAF